MLLLRVSRLTTIFRRLVKVPVLLFYYNIMIFFYLITSLHSFRFCPARVDKSVDFSPFHSIVYIHPPPTYLFRASASFTDRLKNSKWLTYFCILLCICYCFSHLIGLRSVTYLSLLYKFTRFSIYFLFLSDEGPMLETIDYTIRIGSTPTFLYFDLYLYSAYAAHFVHYDIVSYVID